MAHLRHLRGFEVGEVDRSHRGATIEHKFHALHLRGIEVFQSFYAFKGLEVLKPIISACGTEVLKRSTKNHLECCCACMLPSSAVSFKLINAPRRSGVRKTKFIVTEK